MLVLAGRSLESLTETVGLTILLGCTGFDRMEGERLVTVLQVEHPNTLVVL